jgi:hydrogenase maturation protein HypF
MTDLTDLTDLAAPVPARVLACGAHLKNRACLVDGSRVHWSRLHGDLSTPEACVALEASVEQLVAQAAGPIAAVAHDLHPDFHSTRVARAWAQRLGVPALAVQHHRAHIAVVQAEAGLGRAGLIGLALDGMGLGSDGQPWGGEVLRVAGTRCERVAHLPPLPLPGGDLAAREPWRLAAAVLHLAGRADAIVPRFGPQVGEPLARGVLQMIERQLNCPRSTSAGRWFDAAAGLLGLSLRQRDEAEAAIALEQAATHWLEDHAWPPLPPPSLDLLPPVAELADETDVGRGAARFHLVLAQALVQAAVAAAAQAGVRQVALGGGCFFNRLLSREVTRGLQAAGLGVLRPQASGCGDAGLALGQAWVAAMTYGAET